jgi:hypothetical protein
LCSTRLQKDVHPKQVEAKGAESKGR